MRFAFAVLMGMYVGIPTVLLADEPAKPSVVKTAETKQIENSIGMRFVLIPKGSFSMGSPPDEDGRSDDEQQHEVSLSRDFYLGMHEVTQSQYEKVMEENLSYFQGTQVLGEDTSRHPVDSVSWEDAIEFCRRLAELPEEKKANHKYRLPTEAEWEYACRAKSRTPTKFSFGIYDAQLGTYAWYASNSGKMTHTIGVKLPNKFGLYDMHGNVWEWCSDWYDDKYYANSPGADPRGPDSGSSRVLRGGSWYDVPLYVRCACRNRATPAHRDRNNGFRVVLE